MSRQEPYPPRGIVKYLETFSVSIMTGTDNRNAHIPYPTAQKNQKILIVEDEAVLRSALRDKLTSNNLIVLEAEDGEEGLKLALSEHPDLILLDLLMPKMDGISMLKRLRQDKWGKGVKVIILTNLGESEPIAATVELGASEYIVKSNWQLGDILAKVRGMLV